VKPYGVKLSHRPGCACCNTRDLHHFRPGRALTLAERASKRAAKKKERARGNKEIKSTDY
jgi:hypothetical protein